MIQFNKLTLKPKRLFLIDGLGAFITALGAFITALFLCTILTRFEEDFGMPEKVLNPLSILACVYCIYSISCYFFVGKHWRPFLNVIAIANIMYCCITLVVVIVFYYALTLLGLIYF
jgi:hypothetical protein